MSDGLGASGVLPKRAGSPGQRRRRLGHLVILVGLFAAPSLVRGHGALGSGSWVAAVQAEQPACPPEMAQVGTTCVDRWEAHTVHHATGERLSPFYPPEPRLLRHVYGYWSVEASRIGNDRARALPLPIVPRHQREPFDARAVSAPGVLPQGYMTFYTAKRACENAGKRLCKEEEWVRACKGKGRSRQPYGERYVAGRCNVMRQVHPAYELHGNSSLGHLDPRLHLVVEEGERPLLLSTGELETCASQTSDGQLYDMVGNLDEWIDDPQGTFVGGFFSRGTREGCEAKVESHAPAYTDYSLGVRCCKDARSRVSKATAVSERQRR